jgi:hypothetical protein
LSDTRLVLKVSVKVIFTAFTIQLAKKIISFETSNFKGLENTFSER